VQAFLPNSGDIGAPSYVGIGGEQVAYYRFGRGPSVALIHGIPTWSYLWRNVIPPLVRDGLEVIALDLLGYGDSDKPINTDLGIAAQAGIVVAALRKLNWSGSAIVGHDIGGGIAQLICANDPEAAKHLVLIDAIAYDSFPEPGIARLKDPVWDTILGAPDFDLRKGLTKGFMRGMVHKDRITPELTAAYERPFQGIEGRLAYLRAARALQTEDLATRMNEVEKLNIPTLMMWGAEDVFQPIRYGVQLAAAMPRARLERVERAGHFLPEDEPRIVARLIADFVNSNEHRSR
jgi:pimeloyl-ACP methyl ester carboxylesterase